MIPSPWASVVLALAAYRIARLIGWDDLPIIERARAWVVGAKLVRNGSTNTNLGLTGEEPELVWTYRRPVVKHFLSCPFCQGFWVSVLVYLAWLGEAHWTYYGAAPLALSAAVGLISKNLDP